MLDKVFTIKGKKDLIFRKESGRYLVYNPISLEYFWVDEIGAMIFFGISKNYNLNKIISLITHDYDVSSDDCKREIINFISKNPLKAIIYSNLVLSGLYLFLPPFAENGTNG